MFLVCSAPIIPVRKWLYKQNALITCRKTLIFLFPRMDFFFRFCYDNPVGFHFPFPFLYRRPSGQCRASRSFRFIKNMQIALNIFFSLLVSGVLFFLLNKSMHVTLYRFRNVMFLAGILFFTSMAFFLGISAGISTLRGNPPAKIGINWFLKDFVRLFIYSSVPILSVLVLLMAISNLSLIRHEGRRIRNVMGSALGFAYLAGTFVIWLLARLFPASDPEAFHFFRDLLLPVCSCILSYLECVMSGIALMGWIASRQKPGYDKDFIIILGCSISKKGSLLPLLKGRVNRAIRYAWEQEIACGRKVLYVPSGGQGEDEIMSEGSAMALYLESHSAEANEVFPEKRSRNTWENFCFSRRIILEQKPDARTAFSTTNYHVFRSGLLARKAGFTEIEAIASTTKWYFWPNGFAREMIGIFAMTWKIHLISALILIVLCILGVLLG